MIFNNIKQARLNGKDISRIRLNGKDVWNGAEDELYVEYTVSSSKTPIGTVYPEGEMYKAFLPSIWNDTVSGGMCHKIEIMLFNGTVTSNIETITANNVKYIRAYYTPDTYKISFNGFSKDKPNYIKTILHIDTKYLTTYDHLFNYCENLTNVYCDLPITSKITSTSYMFNYCTELLETPITSTSTNILDFSNVTDMSHMFDDCYKLNFHDISHWKNLGNVTNMECLFSACRDKDATLDVSSWDVSSLVNASYMFDNCYIKFTGLNNWNVESLVNAQSMFQSYYKSIEDIDWYAPNLTNIDNMFQNSYVNYVKLTAPLVTSLYYTFYGSHVVGVELNGMVISSDASYAFYDCGYLQYVRTEYPIETDATSYMFYNCNQLYEFPKLVNLCYCEYMFYGTQISEFDASEYNFGQYCNFESMFENCYGLNYFSWRADSYVYANTTRMFKGCNNLYQVEFDRSSKFSIYESSTEMFYDCYSLDSLYLTGVNTYECYNYSDMFYNVNCEVHIGYNWTLSEEDTGYTAGTFSR